MVEPDPNEVLGRLCSYDPRNPSYMDFMWEEGEIPDPANPDCSCDNCFYGRTPMAKEILSLREELFALHITINAEAISRYANRKED